MNNNWHGMFEIEIKDKLTGQIKTEVIRNRITNVAINELADVLVGNAPDLEIAYLAVGSSNAPIDDTDTILGSEAFRTQPTAGPTRTATGEITTEFTILDSEAVGQIEEIGIFCGSSASLTEDTGILLTRILWSKTKSSTEELTFKRIDRIRRGT
jgi:hypothetical protein